MLRSIKLVYNNNEGRDKGVYGFDGPAEAGNGDFNSSSRLKWVLIVVVAVCFILIIAVVVLAMLYKRKRRTVNSKVIQPGQQMQGTEV